MLTIPTGELKKKKSINEILWEKCKIDMFKETFGLKPRNLGELAPFPWSSYRYSICLPKHLCLCVLLRIKSFFPGVCVCV